MHEMTPDQQREFVQHLRAVRTSPQSFNKAIKLDSAEKKPKKPSASKINEDLLAGEYGV